MKKLLGVFGFLLALAGAPPAFAQLAMQPNGSPGAYSLPVQFVGGSSGGSGSIGAAGTNGTTAQSVQGITGGVPVATTDTSLGTVAAGAAPVSMHMMGCSYNTTGLPTPTAGQSVGCQVDNQGAFRVTPLATSSSFSSLPGAQTATVAGTLVLKASPGNLYELDVTPTVAGYLMTFNAVTAPADGTVTPVRCQSVAANTTSYLSIGAVPEGYSVGISAAFSTTGCFTKTVSATAFIHGNVK